MLNKSNPNIKEVVVNFSDLINLKEKLDKLEEKCIKALNSETGITFGIKYTTHLLDKRDRALFTFVVAAKKYYNTEKSDFDSLVAKYEEERKYVNQATNYDDRLNNNCMRLFMHSYYNSCRVCKKICVNGNFPR